jgi:hypothetical protein
MKNNILRYSLEFIVIIAGILVSFYIEKQNAISYKDELKKRDNQIDELIKKAGINNSTITQNIQNNIKVLAYKNTDMSKLTDKDILKCLNHSNMCVPYLIKMIHLDPKKPENHNVYISNLPQACLGRPSLWKNNHVMLYDGNKWKLKDTVFTKDKGKVFSCFACGGSSMGYKLAGFDVIGINEINPKIMNTKPKAYKDYKSNAVLLDFLKKLKGIMKNYLNN